VFREVEASVFVPSQNPAGVYAEKNHENETLNVFLLAVFEMDFFLSAQKSSYEV